MDSRWQNFTSSWPDPPAQSFDQQLHSLAPTAELVTNLAEQVRAEPGNERFELYVRADQPREHVVFEI